MAKASREPFDAKTSPLMVRLNAESMKALAEAAQLRHLSVSEYVRTVAIAQARREIALTKEQVLLLSPEEQLVFWQALNKPAKLTPAQKRLGALMRGKR